MIKRTNDELMFRKLICENILERRRIARFIRDYAKYDLSKRKIRSVMLNNDYLITLLDAMKQLDVEYKFIFNTYLKYKGNKC